MEHTTPHRKAPQRAHVAVATGVSAPPFNQWGVTVLQQAYDTLRNHYNQNEW